MSFRCVFHVHTRRSFDSILSPRKILDRARELGVKALVVTDHNTIQGSLEVRALAAGDPPIVITAAEYQSEKGDIVCLFLKEEIRSRLSAEIIRQTHAQGGLVVLPHPYKGHMLDDDLLAEVDLIESYNGRCSDNDNALSQELALKWNYPVLGGADAHCSLELDAVVIEFTGDSPRNEAEFREQLLSAPRRISSHATPPFCRPYSQMIKAIKTRNPRLFAYQARRMMLVLARGERP
jgi:predicted metal-dependent phosphoesterase TrpH